MNVQSPVTKRGGKGREREDYDNINFIDNSLVSLYATDYPTFLSLGHLAASMTA